jgi:replicative DNA helicase
LLSRVSAADVEGRFSIRANRRDRGNVRRMAAENTETIVTRLRTAERDAPGFRVPPRNVEAEQALLGAILVNNRAYERVAEFLRPEHFSDRLHGRVYEACARLIERGQIADGTTLKHVIEGDPELGGTGGAEYVARLARAAVTVINAGDYGRIVYDLHLRRRLIDLGEDVVNDAYEMRTEAAATDQIAAAEQKLYDLATEGDFEGGFRPFRDAIASAIDMAQSAFQREGRLTGVATGLGQLDILLGGLHASDLIVLAGRPSMGKTALATNMAFHAAKSYREEVDEAGRRHCRDGAVVGFFSLEMSAEQLATRILGEEAQVPPEKIRKGEVTHEHFERVVRASQLLQRAPFFIDDTPALTISALRTRARRLKRQHGLGLIVVDYLQLLRSGVDYREQNRVLEISEITRGLKTLAKELNVPVLALSQLSRAVEQRDDKRPLLSDLRESGAIEQDADVVMFIYREEYYLERHQPREGTPEHDEWAAAMDKVHNLAEVIVAKQRHGPTGRALLKFEGTFTKFANLDENDRSRDIPF